MAKVSVIVAVYGAEAYIERCARSLFGQTLEDMEFVFVDDCSPDGSIAVLERVIEEFPQRNGQVKMIRNERNRGVGSSRQIGIDAATGEYLIHCDPDDWVEPDMYERLYETAMGDRAKGADRADVVVCDFFENTETSENVLRQVVPDSIAERISAVAAERLHMSLCNKLIKGEVAKSIRVLSGLSLWEDWCYNMHIMLGAYRIIKADEAFYHYRVDNGASIVHTINRKHIDSMMRAVDKFNQLLSSRPELREEIDPRDILLIKWKVKCGYLTNPTRKMRREWLEIYPETNRAYWRLNIPLKGKICTFCMVHNQLWFIRLYNRLRK